MEELFKELNEEMNYHPVQAKGILDTLHHNFRAEWYFNNISALRRFSLKDFSGGWDLNTIDGYPMLLKTFIKNDIAFAEKIAEQLNNKNVSEKERFGWLFGAYSLLSVILKLKDEMRMDGSIIGNFSETHQSLMDGEIVDSRFRWIYVLHVARMSWQHFEEYCPYRFYPGYVGKNIVRYFNTHYRSPRDEEDLHYQEILKTLTMISDVVSIYDNALEIACKDDKFKQICSWIGSYAEKEPEAEGSYKRYILRHFHLRFPASPDPFDYFDVSE
jgi:hypothetical protein